MRESVIEKHLCDRVKGLGGEAYKFKSPNRANVPDRLVLLPGHHIHFVELKATDEEPTEAQVREHNRLKAMGFSVSVIDTIEKVDKWIELRRTKL